MGIPADFSLLANILEYSPALICAVDPHGQLQHVSGACRHLLGRENNQLVGQAFADIVHPEDRAAALAACERAREQDGPVRFESRCLNPAGEEVVLEWSAFRPPADALLLCIGRDVTEQRQAARHAREQDAYHRAVTEHGFDMMGLLSEECCYLYVGGSITPALGYQPEELLGRSAFDFIHPDDVAAVQASWTEQSNQPIFTVSDFRFRAAGGEWRWMETSVSNQLLNPDIRAYTAISRDVTERKLSSLAQYDSEQRFRALFDNDSALAAFIAPDGRILDANPALLAYLNKARHEVLNLILAGFLPEEVRTLFIKNRDKAASGQKTQFETSVQFAGRQAQTLKVAYTPLVVEGAVVGIYFTVQDITEMAAAQRLIKQQAARLHMVLESIADAFLSTDKDWNLTYLNSEGERLLDLRSEEALGKNMWELFPEEASSIYRQKYPEALNNGQTVQFETYSKREKRWFELKVYPFAEGVSVFFADITKRVESDKQLKLLALVAQGTVNSVIITDAQGRTEWVNDAFTKDTGYTLAEMLGQKPGAVLQGPETDPAAIRRFQERLPLPKPFSVTVLNYKKSGQKLWFAMDITPIFNDAGDLTQFIAIQQNINFRKEIEASQAKMTQDLYRHNRDLQQFTYVISHNLRAPLANALGLATVLTKVDKNTDVFATALANLRQSMVQADNVLKDLNMVLSIRDKKDMQPLEPLALKEVCEQAINNMDEALHQCGGRVALNVEDHLMTRGSRAYLYSIFYNLLSNSIKYRSGERPLQVDIQCHTGTHGGPTITFTDNGSGFDMFKAGSDVFQLYKRFHTNQRGRGIGLFLVKTHVEAMGGKIEVASEVNFGTRFTIHLDKR
ncbi:PAS domain-containing sensor histidine kinase [Hymenobacter terricola]|uniref:PAS domain-containing sensor histidine kinase n=1 Tax=Hymenobacter terricola TaxID=2819236 RepID=UPI001B309E93|nr:PAS domain-containing sensor histidine kinase [Hymenobacter terricola]